MGENTNGRLGDGSGDDSSEPVPVDGLSDATHLGVGGRHACAVRSTGAIACWGANNHGQLGDGSTTDRPTPVAVMPPE